MPFSVVVLGCVVAAFVSLWLVHRRTNWSLSNRRGARIILILFWFGFTAWLSMIRVPGRSFTGDSPDLANDQVATRDRIEEDVIYLSEKIGTRNLTESYPQLMEARDFVESRFVDAGYSVVRHEFTESWGISVIMPTFPAKEGPCQVSFPESGGRISGRSGRRGIRA
ncbi:MAG: hypothetical protein R3E01_30595 [Pirellulaceae bacterium]|nr:hypothetical protein [Planctomycetales bacterium]